MMNNYNPFTVPKNFFEQNCNLAVTKYKRRKRQVICGIAATVAALVLVFVPVFMKETDKKQDLSENSLAELYEYDVFLEINF